MRSYSLRTGALIILTFIWTISCFSINASAGAHSYDYQNLFEMADDWDGNCTDLFWLISSWHKPIGSVPTPTPGDLNPTPTPTYSGQVTEFPGGTLDDLRALSSNLTFDHLVISGRLNLPLPGSASLSVNYLTITSSGSVGYTRGECDYLPAPNFSVQAVERVVVDGDILLSGRSGTRVTASATCNSCYGCDGGDVRIEANEIVITGSIQNYGGAGGTSVSSYGSSGCSGGDAGGIYLTATTLTIQQATLYTKGGRGGTGYISGEENHGANGETGPVELIIADLFEMEQSSISTDGTLTFQAGRTNVYGPIDYGEILENIGGNTDSQGPIVEILSPAADSVISPNEPLEIRVRIRDFGTGVKEVQVSGLGYEQTHLGSEIIDGILSITLSKPTTPVELGVMAYDNRGNLGQGSVSGLSLQGDLLIPFGETYVLSDDLDLGSASTLDIRGTMIIKRGSNPTLSAGSLTMNQNGRIEIEEPGETLPEKAPSLTINLNGGAELRGTIDLSGHRGLSDFTENDGEDGGDFTLQATSILLRGHLYSNGGDGRYATWGWPERSDGAHGGDGGAVTLSAAQNLTILGTVSVSGGDHVSIPSCYTGGDGGTVTISYATAANVSAATFFAGGGTRSQTSCAIYDGTPGAVWIDYQGAVTPQPVLAHTEVEPNSELRQSQMVFFPAQISGTVSPDDVGEVYVTFTDESQDHFEDLYMLRVKETAEITVRLEPGAANLQMALYIMGFTYESMPIYIYQIAAIPGETIEIGPYLYGPDIYLFGVSQFGDTPTGTSGYTFSILSGS